MKALLQEDYNSISIYNAVMRFAIKIVAGHSHIYASKRPLLGWKPPLNLKTNFLKPCVYLFIKPLRGKNK